LPPAPAKPLAQQKAAKIIIPKVDFRDATVEECLDFLRQKAHEASPDDDVNMLLCSNVEERFGASKVTFSVANISLLDAFQYVGTLANLSFQATDAALIMGGGMGSVYQPVPSKTWDKAKSLMIPQVVFKEVSVGEALDFLRAKAAELDPDKEGINLILKPGPGTNNKVTLLLKNVSVGEAIQYVAGLAGLAVFAHPNTLIVLPQGEASSMGQPLQ
jgi:hypothetical protein